MGVDQIDAALLERVELGEDAVDLPALVESECRKCDAFRPSWDPLPRVVRLPWPKNNNDLDLQLTGPLALTLDGGPGFLRGLNSLKLDGVDCRVKLREVGGLAEATLRNGARLELDECAAGPITV